MSIRIKIAKWLAPEWDREFWEGDALLAKVVDDRNEFLRSYVDRGQALRNIIALKTPKCAHIGKRMADIAEAAIKSGEGK